VIYLDDKKSYTASKVYFISSPNNVVPNLVFGERCKLDCSFFRNESLHYVRELALRTIEQCEQVQPVSRKLLIGRKGVLRRYNQDEVLEILQPFGFELVYMEDYPFDTQVKLFSEADYVVGPTGAAWVGLLYMQPKSKALCWMASETGEFSCYSQLAHFSEVELTYISYDTGAESMPDLRFLGYQIDISQLKQWLAEQGFYNELQ
jgi:capsular polysaccharide biosynthesis protein